MAGCRGKSGPTVPDNRVLEAIFVLINCRSAQAVTLETAFSILDEAVRTNQLVVEHSPDGWPCGFAVWQTHPTDCGMSVHLQWFVALSGFRVSFMRSLRHVHFADRAILRYTRMNNRGSLVARGWSKRHLGDETPPKQDHSRSTVEEIWFDHWGVDRWPGRIAGKGDTTESALRKFREYLISQLSPEPGERFIVSGSGSGRLAYELSEYEPALVLDVHSQAYTMDRAAFLCREKPNAQHFHGSIECVLEEHSSFDGAIVVCISQTAKEVTRSIRALSQLLRVGARAVIADYTSRDSETARLQSTPAPIPSASDWKSIFQSAGFNAHRYDDLSDEAVETFINIASTIAESDSGENAADAASRLNMDAEAVDAGAVSWGVWNAQKTRSVDVAPFVPDQSRTLVMLSGGIDSVYTLWDVLVNTTHEVIAHHIHFLNLERRVTPEARACQDIVRWLEQNVRPLTYSETTLDRQNLLFFGHDMVAIGFEAGLAAQNYRYRHDAAVDYWRVGSCLEEGGWPTRWPHVINCCAAASHPFDPPRYVQAPIVSKSAQVEAMPRELTALTWGCRRPVWKGDIAVPCGQCVTCRDRKNLGLS